MATDGEQPAGLDPLTDSVCSDPEIDFAVVFGSWITGERTETSDLDLALKFVDGLSAHERFQRRCFLAGDLQREDLPFVDVSDIETLPLDVRHDAVTGEFLCGDRQAFERFRTDVEEEYAEQRETLRRRQRAVIDRIAEDGLRG